MKLLAEKLAKGGGVGPKEGSTDKFTVGPLGMEPMELDRPQLTELAEELKLLELTGTESAIRDAILGLVSDL